MCSPGLQLPFMSKTMAKVLYPWRDYGTPDSIRMFGEAVKWLLSEIRSGKMVETGCMGGHGRTGTMLACLLVLQGENAVAAIQRVRRGHCQKAVETIDQQNFVRKFDAHVNDRPYVPLHAPPLLTGRKAPMWSDQVRKWTDGMSPATRLDLEMETTAIVRLPNDDDGAEYEAWWRLNAAGIAASLDAQDWPRRDGRRYAQDDYEGYADEEELWI